MSFNPSDNIGKICRSLEQYWDVAEKKMKVKARPILIIGHEENYTSPINIDYEFLPISKLIGFAADPVYDVFVQTDIKDILSLNDPCYIRSHKTSWAHSKRIDLRAISDLKQLLPEFYNEIIEKNISWITNRSNLSKAEIVS